MAKPSHTKKLGPPQTGRKGVQVRTVEDSDDGRAPEPATAAPNTVVSMARVELYVAQFAGPDRKVTTELVFLLGGVPHQLPSSKTLAEAKQYNPQLSAAFLKRIERASQKMPSDDVELGDSDDAAPAK